MQKVVKFFDKLEDRIREHLSRVPIVYGLLGGVSIVLFWRGVWDMADILAVQDPNSLSAFIFHPLVSLLISIIVMLGTGLFVSFFIGERIIMSGLRHEKKVEEKTESEVREEEEMLWLVNKKVDSLAKSLEEIRKIVDKK